MKTEITTRDEQIDGTWCDVPYVTMRKSDYDKFMEAVRRMICAAEEMEWFERCWELNDAIDNVRKLEGGE